jgi:DNA-binding response OmpR family regulator
MQNETPTGKQAAYDWDTYQNDTNMLDCPQDALLGRNATYDWDTFELGIYNTLEKVPENAVMSKILVVEDDKDLAQKIVECLSLDRHFVEKAHSGAIGLEFLRTYDFDAVVLDWQLPELTGIEVCKTYRANGGNTPILMLTGRSSIDDKEDGLDAGADDYLTKPFHLRELRARVKALLRRKPLAIQQNTLCVNDLKLDRLGHSVTYNGQNIHVSPREFALLEFLMSRPEELFSAEALIERVWSDSEDASVASVRAHIKSLRQKLAIVSSVSIQTIHGVGYKLRSA